MRHALSLTLLCVLACDRPAVWDRPLETSAPVALARRVAWVSPGWPHLAVLDPADMSVGILELGGVAPWHASQGSIHAHPDGRHLLILKPDAALYIDAEALEVERSWALSTPFARATFSPDGARVILHHDPGLASGGALSNPNQLALIELGSDAAPISRTLMAFGAEPQRIIIDPTRTLLAQERQWAWIFSERYLAFFDLLEPDEDERVVHLVLEEDEREVEAKQIQTLDGETFFIRAEPSSDLFSVTFNAAGEGGALPRPWLNQLDTGGQAFDMLAVELGSPRVFTINPATEELSIINPDTGRRVAVSVGFGAQRITPFEVEGRPAALLWSLDAQSVAFVDLTEVESARGRAITLMRLDAPLTALHPLPERAGAVAQLSGDRLALLDFEAESAVPLSASGKVVGLSISEDGAWFYAVIRASNGLSMISVDTETVTPKEVELGFWSGLLLEAPGAARLVVVDTGDSLGAVTVVPSDQAVDEASVQRRGGILMEGVLER